ncbi:fibronectin type III domain-containing protein [Candidatus Foliamicus sp.]
MSAFAQAQTNTLTFTFSDDGSTVTIAASGSLDVTGFNFVLDTTPSAEGYRGIQIDDTGIWQLMPQLGATPLRYYDSLPDFVTTVITPYTGSGQIEFPSNYTHDFAIRFTPSHKWLYIDTANLSGNIYDPTGDEVTFSGTLLSTLGDNDFDIQHAIGNQTIVFKTAAPAPAPAAPTGLAATAGDTAVTLNWTDPNDANITGYQVRYGAGSTVPATATWDDIDPSDDQTTSHVVTGLTNVTQYAFEIRAVNANGNSDASSTVTATPALAVPDAPANLTASAGGTHVYLTWTNPTNASSITNIQVRYKAAADLPFDDTTDLWTNLAATRTDFDAFDPTPDTEYRFQVRAINSAGNGQASEVSVTTGTVPSVEDITRHMPTTSPTNADTLTWQVVFSELVLYGQAGGPGAYEVAYDPPIANAPTLVANRLGAARRCVRRGDAGLAFSVEVYGGDLANYNGTVTMTLKSDGVIRNCDGTAVRVRTPTGTNDNTFVVDNVAPTVTVTGVSGTVSAAVEATFTFTEEVTGFDVGDIVLTNAAASEFSGSGTTYKAIITPAVGGAFSVGVAAGAAQDAAGNDNAAATTVTAQYDATPSFGTGVTIADQTYTQNAAITTLTLPEATSGNGTLTYSLTPAAPAGLAFDATARTLTGTPTTLQQATAYTYTATDEDGDTVSLAFNITIESLTPAAPTGLIATAGDALVALAWSNPQDSTITKYQVRYGAGSAVPATATWGDITGSGAGTTSHTVTGLTNGTQYAFEIRAVNADGNSDASSTVTATPAQSQTSQTNAPSISLLQPRRAAMVVNWNWVDTTGGACSMAGANSGFEIEYKKATEPNWKLAWQSTANTADHGVFELYNQQNWDRGLAPNGTLLTTFTIDANAEGREPVSQSGVALDAVQYQVRMAANSDSPSSSCDVTSSAYSAIASVTVLPSNQAPTVASAIADQSAVSGVSATVDISSTFSDPDNDTLTYTASSDDTAKATVAVSGSTLTLTGGAPGTAKITVTATDPYGAAVSDEFDVTVTNNAPTVANAIADQTVDVGSNVAVALETTGSEVFADPDSNPLTYSATSGDTAMATVVVDNAANTVTVTGVAAGTPTITVTASDGYGGTVSDDFIVTVNQPNRAPTVANAVDDQSVAVNASVDVDVSAVFNDLDNDTLTLSATSSDTATATATVSGTTLTLTGVATGTAQVTLTAADGNGGQASDTFDVTVTSGAPVVANPIADIKISRVISRDFELTSVFSDPDGDTLTYSASSSATNVATVSLTGSTLTVSGALSLGTATVTVTATDPSGASVSDQFEVTVQNAIQTTAPTIVSLVAGTGQITVTWDWSDNTGGVCLLTGDRSGFEVQYKKTSLGDDWHEGHDTHPNAVDHGVFELIGPGQGSLRQFVIKEGAQGSPGQIGVALDPVDYDVRLLAYSGPCEDSSVEPREPNSDYSAIATTALNNAPTVANAIADQTVQVGSNVSVALETSGSETFTDPDGDTLTYTVASSDTAKATVAVSGSTVTVTGVAEGESTITVTADDGKTGGTASTTFKVTVTAATLSFGTQTIADQSWTQFVQITDVTLPQATGGSGALSYSLSPALPAGVSFDTATRVLSGTPSASLAETTFTYTATDAASNTASLSFKITVAAGNRTPVVVRPIPDSGVWLNTPFGHEVFARRLELAGEEIFSDADGDALTYSATSANPAVASIRNVLNVVPDGLASLEVLGVTVGTAEITLRATDPSGAWAEDKFNITVIDSNGSGHMTSFDDVTISVNGGRQYVNPPLPAVASAATASSFSGLALTATSANPSVATAEIINRVNGVRGFSFATFNVRVTAVGTGVTTVTVTANSSLAADVTETFTVTVTGAIAPAQPSNLRATPGDGQVTLNWDNPSDTSISKYQVRQAQGTTVPDSTAWTDITGSGAATISHIVTGLTNGQAYAFQIRAVNATGDGATSATVTATPEADSAPSFGTETVADQTYAQNAAIATLNLPAATGGNGTLTYSLTPAAPAGLAFDATARTLTGTPTTAQSATAYAYTATDADGDAASLTFNITVTADTQAPRVASIVRHDPPTSPTNAVTLTWRVTFSEAVVNVSDDDFHVGGTDGTETATAVGTDGTTWDVNVAGGNLVVLAGTVNLEFVQGQDIEDTAGNALTDTTPTGTNDDTYLLDRTPPHVTSIHRYDSETGNTDAKSPTNRDSVQWSVQYNESMRNSGAGSAAAYTVTFVPAITQEPTLTVTPAADDPNVCGDLTPYVVNISGGALADYNGTATLTLNHAQVTDCVGNTLRNRTPPRGNQITYELDNTAPTVAITGVSGTVNAAVDATFTFSESVTGFEAGDITLTNADASDFAQPDPAAPVYTAKITPKAEGEFSVAVAAAVAQDAAGNDNAAATTVTAIYDELEPPAKPRSLVAIAGDAEVTLIWANPGDDSITKYQIFNSETVGINLWDDIPGSGADTITHTVTGLTNGTEYTFQIRAVAGSLLGEASDAVKATPQVAVPDAPDNLTATAGDRSVSLSWDLPTNASALDKVQVRHQARGETTWEPWTDLAADATTHTVANLKNGQDYLFEVRAESASGAGPAARTAGTPELAVPGAPTGLSATAGNAEVDLNWTLPTNTSEIDAVQVRWKATADLPFDDARDKWTDLPSADATSHKVTGLTNGTGYTFQVRATNSAGNGDPATGAATPRAPPLVTPGAPTNLSTVPGDTEVVVLWTLPTNTSQIDSVELRHKVKTAPDTGWSAWTSLAGTADRSRVTGLVNGTDYLFEVRAVNTAGTGPSASVEGTPQLAKPSAPSNLQASAGDTRVTLTWDLPDKGTVDTIDVRHKKKTDTSWSQWTRLAKDATTHTETGLDNGVPYEFEVRATNAAGSSDSVAVDAQPKLAVPDAPGNLTAAPGDGKVRLTWDLPTNTSEIDRMQVAHKLKSAANFQPWVDLAKDATSHEVTGLTNGSEYTFIVRALNGAGRGAVAEVDSTPVAVPTAPTGLAATPGDTQVGLSWTLPTNSGVLTKVQARHKADTAKDWEAWVDLAANATTHTVTGLTNGELYNFEVRAENASGPGAAASVSATPVPPLVAPGAPTKLSAVPGDTEVVVLWTLPTNTRQIDSVELRHKVKAAPDTGWSAWTSLAGTAERSRVTGLVNGTDYLFEVRAVNTAGTGPSASVEGTPELAKPSSPSNLQASSGDTTVTLTWDLPDKGTVDTIDVRHKKKTDTSWNQWTRLAKDATTTTVTALDNGVTYEFEVRASNLAGSSDSVAVDAQPKLAVPDAPTSLTATGGNAQVELSWALPTNASVIGAVQVRWKATADLPFTASDAWTDLAGTATAYTATGLTNGTGYTFEVRATNTAGDGPAATTAATPMAPSTPARTLTFTFSDDGSTSTVAASGSLDVSSFNPERTGTKVEVGRIRINDTEIYEIRPSSATAFNRYNLLPDFVTTGLSSYDGTEELQGVSDYVSNFYIRFSTYGKYLEIDQSNLTGNIYNPTGDQVTFSGTLLNTLGDNDFHIELAFGNQKIVYTATPPPVPATPANLAAAPGDTEVTLSWNNPNDSSITKYQLRQAQGASVPGSTAWADITGSGAGTTSHTVTGLTNGQQYAFQIRAVNNAGNSDASDTVTATPRVDTDPSFGTQTIADQSYTRNTAIATLTLPEATGGNGTLTYSLSPNAPAGLNFDATNRTLTGTPSAIQDATQYTYTATDADGDTASLTFNITIAEAVEPPAKPRNFTAVAGDTEVTLNWEDPRDDSITKYQIFDFENVGFDLWDDIPGSGATTTTHTVTGLTNGTEYSFQIRAVAGSLPGDASDAVKATPQLAVPDAPTGLSATAGNAEVDLAWTLPTNTSEIVAVQVRWKATVDLPFDNASDKWTDLPSSDATDHKVTGLTNGTGYTFQVRATNKAGNGQPATGAATPRAPPGKVPSAPADLASTPGDTRVTLSWTLPTDGGALTKVQVRHQARGETTWEPWTDLAADATTHTVANLRNGQDYLFEVRAESGAGAGPAARVTGRPELAVPGAPTGLSATAGNAEVDLAWTLPTNTSEIVSVQVRWKATVDLPFDDARDKWTDLPSSAATDHKVTGLTNGTGYTFQVRATNKAGNGDPATGAATPRAPPLVAPGAPTNLSTVPGDTEVVVLWTLPTNTSQIDSVELRHKVKTAPDTGWSQWTSLAGTAERSRVTGLVNGTDYLFEVRAVNTAGTGPSASVEGTPQLAKPSSPSNLQASAGDTTVTLTWDLPDKGTVDSIDVRHKKRADTSWGQWTRLAADATTHTVTGLDNGVPYEFEVRATNAAGSSDSVAVAGTPKLAVPDAPGNLTATVGDGAVGLTWDLPTNTSEIDNMQVAYRESGAANYLPWVDLAKDATSYDVTGLTNGTEYNFIVRALNGAGRGAEAKVDATPEAGPGKVPSAPADLAATAGDTQVTLTWTHARDNSITKYQVRYIEGASVPDSEPWTDIAGSNAGTTGHTVTGLTNDTLHAFEIRAVNADGAGAASAVTATPKLAIPDAPGNLTAAPGDGKVGLTWDLPTNTSEIDRMQVAYKLKSAANFQPWVDLAKDATSHEVTGLTNGSEYTFIVRALNGAGRGAVAEVDATPVAVPTAPTGLAAAPGDTQVVLSWTLPANSGALTRVQARHKADTAKDWEAWVDLAADATTHTVTGLTNGELYNFEVRAENASGPGAAASVSATPVPPLVAPGAPTNLSAVPGDTEVVVLWTLPTNTRQIDSVELRHKVKAAPDTGWSEWSSLAGTAERSRVTGLVNGTDYLFEVRAVNAAGTGPSASVEGTPQLAKPSAPSNLQASAGDTRVTLTWDLPDKGTVDTIDVRHKKKTDTAWGQWTRLAKDATTTTVTALDNGVTYEFEVRASNLAGSSDSVAVDAQPKLAVPDAPTSLTATGGNAQVELSWTLPTNASVIGAVQVRWKATADLPFTASEAWTDLAGTATAYTATGLTNGTGYTFEVRATNTAGNGPAATAAATPMAPTPPPSAPAAPANLAAAPGDTEVTLSWNNPNDSSITKYQFRQAQGQTVPGSTAWADITGSGAGTTSHTVTGLTNGQQYAFQIRAVNNAGNSDASDTVTATPVEPVPSFGTQTVADQTYAQDLAITTLNLPEATGGNTPLTYTLTPTPPAGLIFDAANRTLAGTPTAVQVATPYTYTVTDDNGDAASLTFNITITLPPAPDAPTGLAAVGSDTKITLTWTDPGNTSITKYQLRYREGPTVPDTADWEDIPGSDDTTTTHQVSGLLNGYEYAFQIRAVNAGGESDRSATVTARPSIEGRPPPATIVSVGPGSNDKDLDIVWNWSLGDSPCTMNSYTIEYKRSDASEWNDHAATKPNSPEHGVFEIYEDLGTGVTNKRNTINLQTVGRNPGEVGVSLDDTSYDVRIRMWSLVCFELDQDFPDHESGRPLYLLGKPTSFTATAGDAKATLAATVAQRGPAIQKWQYTYKEGAAGTYIDWTDIADSASLTISDKDVAGLTNGTTYTFKVRGEQGAGAESDEVTVTPVSAVAPSRMK